MQAVPFDRSLFLLRAGYPYLGRLRGRSPAVRAWLLGQPVVVVGGAEGARAFYDSDRFQRAHAIPRALRRTLFGEGAVHGLDGTAHRVRKAMFLAAVAPASVARLTGIAELVWRETVDSWCGDVVLFDEAARVLTVSALRWAGVPEHDVAQRTADLVAVIDGFGPAPRHPSARRARRRAEGWVGQAITAARAGHLPVVDGSPLQLVLAHRDANGHPLDDRLAAVELLNVVRPTVAVAWFVAFAAVALHEHPQWRSRLADGDDRAAEAFSDEVRRYYPFVPALGARARGATEVAGLRLLPKQLVVLDVYGTDHDPTLWPDPERFDPDRFLQRRPGPFDFVPQGGGDPATGHRCPGERVTTEMVKTALRALLGVPHVLPEQDLGFPLARLPTRPRSGVVLRVVR